MEQIIYLLGMKLNGKGTIKRLFSQICWVFPEKLRKTINFIDFFVIEFILVQNINHTQFSSFRKYIQQKSQSKRNE